MNTNDQLTLIEQIREKSRKNPRDYKGYTQPDFNGKLRIHFDISNDWTEYIINDFGGALRGANEEEIDFYKDFLKLHYNANCEGRFEYLKGSHLHKQITHEQYCRRLCVLSGKKGHGSEGAQEILNPDQNTIITGEAGTPDRREGFDKHASHTNLFDDFNDLDTFDNTNPNNSHSNDQLIAKISLKKASEYIARDCEINIFHYDLPLGPTLLQGIRRILKLTKEQKRTNNKR